MSIKDIQLPQEPMTMEGVGEVTVRGLSLKERMRLTDLGDNAEFVLQLLATCVEQDGAPVGTSEDWDRYCAVHEKEAGRAVDLALTLSGLREKKEQEELEDLAN